MPYIETAFFGDDGEEAVLHFGGVRMRIIGAGTAVMTMASYNNSVTQNLKDLPMSGATAIEPTRLANFKSQRGKLRIETLEINEYISINRIVLFVKPIYASLPQ